MKSAQRGPWPLSHPSALVPHMVFSSAGRRPDTQRRAWKEGLLVALVAVVPAAGSTAGIGAAGLPMGAEAVLAGMA